MMWTQITLGILITLLITLLGWWRRALSPSGAAGAMLVGSLIFGFGGWVWGLLLGIFFVSSSLLSHFKEAEKEGAAEKFEKGHQRDGGQALANGGVGALLAVLSAVAPSPWWFPLFVGVMATVTADTWATELGTLSRRPPRLITSGAVVAVGTSGGVSWLGLAVSLLGGLVVGGTAGIFQDTLRFMPALLLGGVGGLAGSLFDSLLGASVQQIYYCDTCQKDTEQRRHKCGHETRPLRGWSWLNNDRVNLLASLVGGATALVLGWLLL